MDHLCFVYGSLKKGFWNHPLLKGSEFIGEARTREKFLMLEAGYPYLFDEEQVKEGKSRKTSPEIIEKFSKPMLRVTGEVYKVSENTLRTLDFLEGVEDNHYRREKHLIILDSGGLRLVNIYLPTNLVTVGMLSSTTPTKLDKKEVYQWTK